MTEVVPEVQIPLEIITKNFELNLKNLTKILKCREVSNSSVVIISVSGEARTGKSVLLTLLMLYLEYYDQPNKFGNELETINSKFPWASGKNSHTFGIWMWPKPFYVKGLDIPILLMDTQGIFGLGDDNAISNKIFALRYLRVS